MAGRLAVFTTRSLETGWTGSNEAGRRELLKKLRLRLEVYNSTRSEEPSFTDGLLVTEFVLSVMSKLLSKSMDSVVASDELALLLLEVTALAVGETPNISATGRSAAPWPRAEAADAVAAGPVYLEGVVAHLMSFANDVASTDKSIEVRERALQTLLALSAACDPPLLACFLPGTLSKLARILVESRKTNRRIVLAALRTLALVINRCFAGCELTEASPDLKSFAELLGRHKTPDDRPKSEEELDQTGLRASSTSLRGQRRERREDRSFRVPRDDRWYRETGGRVSNVLSSVIESRDGPASHRIKAVRLAFAETLADLIIRWRALFSGELVDRALLLCAGAAADQTTRDAVPALRANRPLAGRLLSMAVARLNESNDVVDLLNGARALHGLSLAVGSEDLLPALSGVDIPHETLVDALSRPVSAPNSPLEGEDAAASHVAAFCSLAGSSICAPALHAALVQALRDRCRSEALAGPCFAVHHLLLGGARSDPPNRTETFSAAGYTGRLAEVLDCLVQNVLPSLDDSEAGLRAKAEVFAAIAEVSERIHPQTVREVILLRVLLPLLERATNEEDDTSRRGALDALARVGECVGYTSLSELFRRHLNFIVDTASRSLSTRTAAKAVRLVVSEVGADAVDILSDSLISVADNLPSAPDRAAAFALETIHGVLVCSVPESGPQAGPSLPRLKRDVISNVLSEISVFKVEDKTAAPDRGGTEDSDERMYADGDAGDSTSDAHVSETSPLLTVAQRTLEAVSDVLSDRSPQIRARALRAALPALQILSKTRDMLLPRVAALLPILVRQLDRSAELDVTLALCDLYTYIYRVCGDFASGRFASELWPAIRSVLRRKRFGRYGDERVLRAVLQLLADISDDRPEVFMPVVAEIYSCVQSLRDGLAGADATVRANTTSVLRGLAVADPDQTWALMLASSGKNTRWRPHSSLQTFSRT